MVLLIHYRFNKENNVFKDALGVKGLGFKYPGNHGSHYGNHHGNYHAEQLLISCQCSKVSSCRVVSVKLPSSIPLDSGHASMLTL